MDTVVLKVEKVISDAISVLNTGTEKATKAVAQAERDSQGRVDWTKRSAGSGNSNSNSNSNSRTGSRIGPPTP